MESGEPSHRKKQHKKSKQRRLGVSKHVTKMQPMGAFV